MLSSTVGSLRSLVLTCVSAVVLACSGGGGSGGNGTLSIAATDAPFPATAGCLDAALVTIDGVTARNESGFVDVPLVDPDPIDGTVTLDLLTLRAGIMDDLAITELPTGEIDEVRLHVVDSVLVFTDGSPDSDFKVPSGSSSGVKIGIDPPALVAAGQTTNLILDIDLANSFHTTGAGGDPTCDDLKDGEPGVIFRPRIHANNESTDAIVLGNVTDALSAPAPDVEVCAYVADTDIVTFPDPEACTFSAPSGLPGIGEGDYALLLPAGDYDLYLREQGAIDPVLALEDVLLNAGESLSGVDLMLP